MPTPVPHTYARRKGMNIPFELAIIRDAVMRQGAAINANALAEETGLTVDAIRRFAAQIAVSAGLVETGQIDFEDSVRLGSQAEAASLRILGLRYDTAEAKPARRTLRTADVMGLRRGHQRIGQDRRVVASARTPCPRCGSRAGADGGCSHQRVMTAAEATEGLPHAR